MHRLKMWGNTPILLVLLCSIPVIKSAPPDALGIPIIKSYLDGSPNSQNFKELSSKLLSASDSQGNQRELNHLISKLKPRQGKLDPVVMDMLSAFDRTYRDTAAVALGSSAETTYVYPDEAASTRVASSTEENGVIWRDTTTRPRKRERDANRFSSRYRSNVNGTVIDYPNAVNDTEDDVPSHVPFNHITDPNLRNHRLYDWEFETYKNFTHIDQAEDLMADEDHPTETKVPAVVSPPPQKNDEKSNKGDTASIPNLWPVKSNGSKSKRVRVKGIPHIVISLEDTSDRYDPVGQSYNYQVDSSERGVQRPREPLRHSSTENIVYVHGSAEYPYPGDLEESDRDRFQQRRSGLKSSQKFRPSSVDVVNDMFVDPDQDFFTSTLRSTDSRPTPQPEQELSSETLPKRRRKKLKAKHEEVDEMSKHASSSNRFSTRAGERQVEEQEREQYSTLHRQEDRVNRGGVHYSPVYSKNSLQGSVSHDRARAHQAQASTHHQQQAQGSHLSSKYAPVKSDRIMYPGGNPGMGADLAGEYSLYNQGQQQAINPYDTSGSGAHLHDGGIGNYYSLHNEPSLHPHSNLGPSGADHLNAYGQNTHPLSQNNPELTSTEYLGGHVSRLQNALSQLNIFGGQQSQLAKKLQPIMADQVIAPGNIDDFYHPYAASDHQVNQFYEDSYYGGGWSNTWFILAGLIAFTALFAVLLPTLLSNQRHGKKDTRHDLDDEDLNSSTSSNNHYHYDNTQNDVNQSDVWSEIKGVYNDIVNMFRGDYTLLTKLSRKPEGPKIVFREEEDQSSEEDEEDDEKNDGRINLRNRKREQFLKKQRQMMQKQQQEKLKQQQNQQPQNQGQGKSHSSTEKILVSKTEANRDGHGKTMDATSVNSLVVSSGPSEEHFLAREQEDNTNSPRASTGFVLPDTSTLATIPFLNLTGFGGVNGLQNSFLSEWAQVQLINNH